MRPAGGPLLSNKLEEFEGPFFASLTHPTIAQILSPRMAELGYGRFVNIISTSVREPIDNIGLSTPSEEQWPLGQSHYLVN